MRLITAALTFLVLTTIVAAVKADDTPKRSAEHQVLDRLVGEWKEVVTNKTDGSTSTTMISRSWSRGGKGVVIMQESINLSDGSESAVIWRYDSENKLYRLAFLLPNGWITSGATWDEKAQTLTWHESTNSWGGSWSGVHQFIDNDNYKWTFVFKNAEGKVVRDLSAKVSRRKETPKTKGN